jgi:uncharacterized LabA/DUF88 family protein
MEKVNFAFIDGQNLNLGIQRLGWKLDLKRFRIYLKEKYGISKAYYFIGYLPENQNLYKSLQEFGYVLIFKPTMKTPDGKIKGNCDAELVLQAMIDFPHYEKAVIVTSDGDFSCLVEYFYRQNKLEVILSPGREHCSSLLRKAGREKIQFLDDLRNKLEFLKEKAPL